MIDPWSIAVVIPARDEEQLLPRCLRSVIAAAGLVPCSIGVTLIVVSDSSTDGTQQLAKHLLRNRGHVLTTKAGAVGTARALGNRFALTQHAKPPSRLWLANTDADCIVPPTWLTDQITLASQSYQAIAGTVSVDTFDEHNPRVAQRFQDTYRIELDGSHPHIHGANIGVRADAYTQAGGWANLKTAEDHDLWRRLRAIGARTISTSRIEVATSGRRIGRAPNGFAAALASHNREEECV